MDEAKKSLFVYKVIGALFLIAMSAFIYFNSKENPNPYFSKAYSTSQDLRLFAQRLSPPPLRWKVLDGKSMGPKDIEGKVVYINFWANWCPPCVEEIPYLAALQDQLKNEDVLFLLVNLDTDEENLIKSKEFYRNNAANVLGLFESGEEMQRLFNVQMLPHHVVLDKKGRVASEFFGDILERKDDIKNMLIKLLQENQASSD